jgi:hypothetical protein
MLVTKASEWYKWSHFDNMLFVLTAPSVFILLLSLHFLDVLSVDIVVVNKHLLLVLQVVFLLEQFLFLLLDLINLLIEALHLSRQFSFISLFMGDVLFKEPDLLVHVINLVMELPKLTSEHHYDSDQNHDNEGAWLLDGGYHLVSMFIRPDFAFAV